MAHLPVSINSATSGLRARGVGALSCTRRCPPLVVRPTKIRAQAEHPEADDVDPETLAFNVQHLGALAARIEQIRQAQALHMLQHRYTPSVLHDTVEESLNTRPELSNLAQEDSFDELDDWHAAQWAKMKDAMDSAPERSI